jgi:hypothetical protein
MSILDPSVFCFTETWHTRNVKHSFFNDYKLIENMGLRNGNIGRYGLGYVVGIKPCLEYELLHRDNYSCCVLVNGKVIVFTYLPSENNGMILNEFLTTLKTLRQTHCHYGRFELSYCARTNQSRRYRLPK